MKKFLTVILFFILIQVSFSFSGGNGSLSNPYEILNCSQLANISSNLTLHYELVDNVNCNIAPYNTGSGFPVIGDAGFLSCSPTPTAQTFTGSFNGNNYEIQNIYINGSGNAPFEKIYNTSISDVSVTNITIIVGTGGSKGVGGLVGCAIESSISNSNSEGIISVGSGTNIGGLAGLYYNGTIVDSSSNVNLSGGDSCGGLVGSIQFGEINFSYSQGNVFCGDRVGGLVGVNAANIYFSYSEGDVNTSSPTFDDNQGGLVGENYGIINSSYTTSNVIGGTTVGGLIGRNQATGEIYNSFSTGNVSGNSQVGGSIGSNSGMTLNVYWYEFPGSTLSSVAGGTTTGISFESEISYFNNCNNEPFSNWTTTSIWNCNNQLSTQKSFFPNSNLVSYFLVLTLCLFFFSKDKKYNQ